MDYTTFCNKFLTKIKTLAVNAGVEIDILDSFPGKEGPSICIKRNSDNTNSIYTCAVLHLPDIYAKWVSDNNSVTLDALTLDTLEKLRTIPEAPLDLKSNLHLIMDKSYVLRNCYPCVVPKTFPGLEQCAHRDVLDLAVVYRFKISDVGDGYASEILKNSRLKILDISESDLWEAANENNRCRVDDIMDIIPTDLLYKTTDTPDLLARHPMYVIQDVMSHAGGLLSYSALDFLEQKLGMLAILPSSVCEVLVIAAEEGSTEKLNTIIQEVNSSMKPNDVLSDHVYFYSDGKISYDGYEPFTLYSM